MKTHSGRSRIEFLYKGYYFKSLILNRVVHIKDIDRYAPKKLRGLKDKEDGTFFSPININYLKESKQILTQK